MNFDRFTSFDSRKFRHFLTALFEETTVFRKLYKIYFQAEITAPFNMMQFNTLRRRYEDLRALEMSRPFHRRNYDPVDSSTSSRGPSHPRRSLNQITQQYYLQRLNNRRTVSDPKNNKFKILKSLFGFNT